MVAITVAWGKKDDKYYRIILIDEWRKINLLNYDLKKKKKILEKMVIKIVIEQES